MGHNGGRARFALFSPRRALERGVSLPEILAGIRRAEAQAGRLPGSVRLVAVTKGHPLAEIREKVLSYGAFPLAENRGQELRDKLAALAEHGLDAAELEWHFIGPVQRNKVKYLRGVRLIHSVEDAEQARAIAEAAAKWGQAPAVLLQRHNGEAQKHGALPEALPGLLREVREAGLDVRGLMVMAPYGQPEAARRVFEETAAQARALELPELSMGMSDDYPAAIAAGSTLVRVGTRLFS